MKKHINRALAAALLLAASAGATSAWAGEYTIQATARVQDVGVRVFDLTPTDGVAAGYTLGPITTSFALAYDYGIKKSNSTFDGAGTVTLFDGVSYAGGSWRGGPGNLEAVTFADSEHGGDMEATARQSVVYTVAAHTLLMVSGTAVQTTQANAGPKDPTGTASVYLTLVPANASVWNQVSFGIDRRSADRYDPFALSYANNSDAAIQVTFNYTLQSHAAISAVPEPSSWLMLGAGLAALAGSGRLRRKLAA